MKEPPASLTERERAVDAAERDIAEQEQAVDALWDTHQKRLVVIRELRAYLDEREAQLGERARRAGLDGLPGTDSASNVASLEARGALADLDGHDRERLAVVTAREALAQRRSRAVDARTAALEGAAPALGEVENALIRRERELADAFKQLIRQGADPVSAEAHAAAEAREREARNRRNFRRVEVCAHVSLETPHNFYEGRAANLGVGGIFLASRNLLSLERPVDLVLTLPGAGTIRIGGRVAWRREVDGPGGPRGVGIRFDTLGPDAVDAIRGFCAQRAPQPEVS